jgi:hypothetical protein
MQPWRSNDGTPIWSTLEEVDERRARHSVVPNNSRLIPLGQARPPKRMTAPVLASPCSGELALAGKASRLWPPCALWQSRTAGESPSGGGISREYATQTKTLPFRAGREENRGGQLPEEPPAEHRNAGKSCVKHGQGGATVGARRSRP